MSRVLAAPRLRLLALGAAVLTAVLPAAGCGVGDSDQSESLSDSKRRVAGLIDATVEATLREFDDLKPAEYASTPCREGGGSGGPTGDYVASGGIRVGVGKADHEELVQRVAEHWRKEGFDVGPPEKIGRLPAVFARTEDYKLSFSVIRPDRAELAASGGPCLEPASEAEKSTPPRYKSLGEDSQSG